MSRSTCLLATLLFVMPLYATGQSSPKCSKGYQPFGEGCVTQRMFDYMSCLEKSGANHQEITQEVNQAANKQLSGEAKGEGSGIVAHGAGSVALSATSEKELVKKIQEKWYAGAMKQCADFLNAPRMKSSSRPTVASPTASQGGPDVGSISQGPGSIAQVGGTGNIATLNNFGPPQRSWTEQQGRIFYEHLDNSPPQHNVIIWARGGEESVRFMKQTNLFIPKSWSAQLMQDSGQLVDSDNDLELWVHPDSVAAKADAVILQNAFRKAGVNVPVVTNSHQDNWKDSVWLVIYTLKR